MAMRIHQVLLVSSLLALIAGLALGAACSGGETEEAAREVAATRGGASAGYGVASGSLEDEEMDAGPQGPAGPAGAPGASGERVVVQTVVVEKEVPGERVVETVVVEKERVVKRPAASGTPAPRPAPTALPALARSGEGGFDSASEDRASQVDLKVAAAAQQRVIVRTAHMTLVVRGVGDAIEEIGRLAQSSGGWIVESEQTETHRGFISIRVPADGLDDTLGALRGLALEVESERTTSQDFTEEFTDLQSRLRTLRATEETLFELFQKAEDVEDAIKVQARISEIQSEIEGIEGRIKFLESSSAFSLINVNLKAKPAQIVVDAGPDLEKFVGEPIRFRATFTPPEGTEDFEIEWDFGDSTGIARTTRTAPTLNKGELITAPITHVYEGEVDSPFIVTVDIRGTGEIGIAEGEDTVMVKVGRADMTVDAGPDTTAAVGEPARFRATFTPPEDIESFEVEWDFGDGSPTVRTSRTAPTLNEGERITAPVTHVYRDDRDSPFIVTVDIRGTGEGGIVEGEDTMIVTVSEIPVIEVFAGESRAVEAGEQVEFAGSFTRPEGLDNLRFRWDFGDGSAPAEGQLGPGVTVAEATHAYPNHRPAPFTARLTVTGDSEAGEARAEGQVQVFVREPQKIGPDWNPGDTGRDATTALANVGAFAARAGIWIGILSPVWLLVAAGGFFAYRGYRRARA